MAQISRAWCLSPKRTCQEGQNRAEEAENQALAAHQSADGVKRAKTREKTESGMLDIFWEISHKRLSIKNLEIKRWPKPPMSK